MSLVYELNMLVLTGKKAGTFGVKLNGITDHQYRYILIIPIFQQVEMCSVKNSGQPVPPENLKPMSKL